MFLSDVPADTTEHGSFFVMAHFHYTIMGGIIFAFFGACYYWLPKMMGIKLNQKLGYLHFWTMFIFFNSTFLPLFAVGMLGQPRRVFEYARNLQPLNDWVSISSFLLGGSILIFVINFIWSTVIVREREVGNPWNSRGLEWQVASPPPPGNFEHIPVVLSGPYDYGVKDAPPVADLHPPVGVVSAVVRECRDGQHRSGGIAMAEQTTQPPNELDRAAEEAGFYHEAALNAAWTGSRFALGALAFLYGCFAFAYFYLRSINSSGRWKGSGYPRPADRLRRDDPGPGPAQRASSSTWGCSGSRPGPRAPGRRRPWWRCCSGVAAVVAADHPAAEPAVPARQFRLLQRVHRHLPGPAGQLARRR